MVGASWAQAGRKLGASWAYAVIAATMPLNPHHVVYLFFWKVVWQSIWRCTTPSCRPWSMLLRLHPDYLKKRVGPEDTPSGKHKNGWLMQLPSFFKQKDASAPLEGFQGL